MKLHEDQLRLIWHLCRFSLLDYESCLYLLDTEETGDRMALSYTFRPLTKNKYLSRQKSGAVSVLKKGKALFPEEDALVSAGGGETMQRRVMQISRMALRMEEADIPCCGALQTWDTPYFIPSTCWRRIAPGLLSTTRFVGMLIWTDIRLAVYDIGDGAMEWQARAEGSLFYTRYGSYETKATGMLLLCQPERKTAIAENIIRQTMWYRKQLLSTHPITERDKPARWSTAPIRLRTQYEHVYLADYDGLSRFLDDLLYEERMIADLQAKGNQCSDPRHGDWETWPIRYFVNPANDLLKYVYFYSALRELQRMKSGQNAPAPQVKYAMLVKQQDLPFLHSLYPELLNMEEAFCYGDRFE